MVVRIMVKEVKKGNKVPYKGFLLNVGEYQEYKKMLEIFPAFQEYVEKEIQSSLSHRKGWH